MNINSKLFVIAQYLLSAIILVLSFKHQMEVLLFICVLVTVAVGMIFINEFGYDKLMVNCSFIGLIAVMLISQGYLEFKIISDFSWLRIVLFILNVLAIIIYFSYYIENYQNKE